MPISVEEGLKRMAEAVEERIAGPKGMISLAKERGESPAVIERAMVVFRERFASATDTHTRAMILGSMLLLAVREAQRTTVVRDHEDQTNIARAETELIGPLGEALTILREIAQQEITETLLLPRATS